MATFEVRNASGIATPAGNSTTNMWRAIESARAGGNGWTVYQTSRTPAIKIFEKNTTKKYYKYVRDGFDSETTDDTNAINFVTQYDRSHIIDNTGKAAYDTIWRIKGTLSDDKTRDYTQTANLVKASEKNVGAFYTCSSDFLNFSTGGSNDYKQMSVEFDLSSIKVKKSTNANQPHNLYFYIQAVQDTWKMYEFGIMVGGSSNEVRPYVNLSDITYNVSGVNYKVLTQVLKDQSAVIATGSLASGVYSFSGRFKLILALDSINNRMRCRIEKAGVKVWPANTDYYDITKTIALDPSATGTLTNNFNLTNGKIKWQYTISYVPNTAGVVDLRSEAYAKNAKIYNPKLHKVISASDVGTSMASAAAIHYAYVMNTDCASYTGTPGGTGEEVVSIFYE